MTRRLDGGECAARTGGPSEWAPAPCPYSPGEWLIGETADRVMAVVAPGVPAKRAETPEDRLRWRLVSWALSAEIAGAETVEADMSVGDMSVTDVLSLVGCRHADWIRGVCAAQLRHLESFGSTLSGQPNEDRARAAADPADRLRRELAATFPGEAWYVVAQPEPQPIPHTAAALLRSVDGPPPARADRLFERFATLYYVAVDVYRLARRRRAQWGHALRGGPTAPRPPAPSATERDDDDREPVLGA